MLGAIVVAAVAGLVDFGEARHLWAVRRADGATWALTFVGTLVVGIEPGILIGIAFSLGLFVVRSAFPHVARLGWNPDEALWRNVRRYPDVALVPGVELLRFDAALYFANAAFLRDTVGRTRADRPETERLVLDLSGVHDLDAVGVETLLALLVDLEQRGVATAAVGLKGPVRDVLDRARWSPERRAQVGWPSIEHVLEAWGFERPSERSSELRIGTVASSHAESSIE